MVKHLRILMKILIMPIIMICRVSAPEAIEFRFKWGFKQHGIVLTKEQSVISAITIFLFKQNKYYYNTVF